MPLEFEEKGHVYRLDGRPIPSVTQIISEFLPFIGSVEAMEAGAHFGTAVHRATEFVDLGTPADIDPVIRPWLRAWERWKTEWLPRQKGVVIADIKTGAFSPSWQYQLGGYYGIVGKGGLAGSGIKAGVEIRGHNQGRYAGAVDRVYIQGRKPILAAVMLLETGEYRTWQPEDSPEMCYQQFLSMYNTWRILQKHKRLKGEFWNEYD